MSYSNSPLVTCTKLSPNCNSPRKNKIDTITIHCTDGQGTAQSILSMPHFVKYDPDNGCSCNYAIGMDGSVGLCVEESDRSWCSSSRDNDNRSVTIEVSSDSYYPYKVTDKAIEVLVDLCADICKRNNIKQLVWSNSKNDRVNHRNGCNMTCHRDFAAKACPGEYLYNLEGWIATQVNAKLKEDEEVTQEQFNVMLKIALGHTQDDVGEWAKLAWEKAKAAGVLDGTAPKAPLTREQVAVVLDRLGLLEKV